jgi:hypothetical protein
VNAGHGALLKMPSRSTTMQMIRHQLRTLQINSENLKRRTNRAGGILVNSFSKFINFVCAIDKDKMSSGPLFMATIRSFPQHEKRRDLQLWLIPLHFFDFYPVYLQYMNPLKPNQTISTLFLKVEFLGEKLFEEKLFI